MLTLTDQNTVSPVSGLDGWLGDEGHIYPLKVQYEDTDAGGVVYHANYLAYAERARSAWFSLIGIDQQAFLQDGMAFVVAALDIRYHRPARLGQELRVSSQLAKMTGVRAMLDQHITDVEGRLLAHIHVQIVQASLAGRPCRFDLDVKRKILATMPPQNHEISFPTTPALSQKRGH
jgi:acyl-CoA thioester hydrolase